jgi:galactokinase
VLAAAINLDIAAVAAPSETGEVRISSEGYPAIRVNLAETKPVESERYTSAALVRGVCARMQELGLRIGGFDATAVSTVPNGAGLSSSAAFEVLVATIVNHFYNNDAIDPVTIARISQHAENRYFGKPCGLMDQTACAVGGLVFIDFEDLEAPKVRRLSLDFDAAGYECIITSTGGSHADLNADYEALEHEMKHVARCLGGSVLRQTTRTAVLSDLSRIRQETGDRAVLRALHFFDDDARVVDQVKALEQGDFPRFLRLIIESGISSWTLCQNYFSCVDVKSQGIAIACALSEELLRGKGAWRVHGGGFAGTVQAFVPVRDVAPYMESVERVFGAGSCHRLRIRSLGACALLGG